MSASTIVVVGSINADDAIRLARLPSPGETVGARSLNTALGGKGANQAVAAARAGARVRMVGAVGSDGDALIAALAAEGVDTNGVARLDGLSSGHAVVLIDDHGENSIVIPGANHAIPLQGVEDACGRLLAGDVLLLQHEVPVEVSRAAARAARGAGATVLWNAAPAPTSIDELIDEIDVLIVNEHELVAVAGLLGIDVNQPDLAAVVAERIAADVFCTLGAAGAVYRVEGITGNASAPRVEVVDTTAAGDTSIGYLAATTGLPFDLRLATALTAGSLAVTRPGASSSIPTRAEVDAVSSSRTPAPTERTIA